MPAANSRPLGTSLRVMTGKAKKSLEKTKAENDVRLKNQRQFNREQEAKKLESSLIEKAAELIASLPAELKAQARRGHNSMRVDLVRFHAEAEPSLSDIYDQQGIITLRKFCEKNHLKSSFFISDMDGKGFRLPDDHHIVWAMLSW